jgi:glucokinase
MIGALDIGGTKIAAGLVDWDGHLIAHQEFPTQATRGVKNAVEQMALMLKQLASQENATLQGVGIGCTGPVYPDIGTIGKVEFMPGWEGSNLVEMLSDRLGVRVAIENDADAAALGEWTWGSGKGTQCFLLVTIGTGIGAGLVINGHIYRGVNSAHPEIGHHVIEPDGPLCFCGAHGCWESLASGPAMERWAQLHFPDPLPLSARQICEKAAHGDPSALAAVKRTGRYLAIGLANLITLYVPERIALGGGLMQSYELFEHEIRSTIQQNCGLVPFEKVQMNQATLGSRTGLIGAACVWLNRFRKG